MRKRKCNKNLKIKLEQQKEKRINNILINVGVFTLSALGFAFGSICIGGIAINFDVENDNACFVIGWAVGIIIYGITVSCMYGGG